jgi:hypothetical protein
MRRRRRKRSSELTALLDVLFILLFASLVQARYSVERQVRDHTAVIPDAAIPDAGSPMDAAPVDAAPPPDSDAAAGAADATSAPDSAAPPPYHQRAQHLSALIAHAVHGREAFVVEVSAPGQVVELQHWQGGVLLRREALHHRLVETVPPEESDDEFRYLGDTQPGQRICPLVLAQLEPRPPDLARALVVIIIDAPLAGLTRALRDGLARDAALCFQDAAGIAILLDPEKPLPWSESHGIE